MSARDELAELLYDVSADEWRHHSPNEAADAIIAAGYVKVSEAAIERAAKAAQEHLNECGYAEESERGYVLVDGTYSMNELVRAVVAALREEA